MPTKVRYELRYDGATPEQVYAMLADQDFRLKVCAYQRFTRQDVTITPTGSGMAVRVDQYRPATEIPSFARKLVGEELNIVQEEQWSSPTTAALTVGMPGKPGEMKGTVTLIGDATGTTEVVEVTVRASIPLIGGKLETLIGDMLGKALRAENHVGKEWLAG